MTPHATLPAIEDDIRFYSTHEEDDVPEGTLHHLWSGYLEAALRTRFPDRFVIGNICIYWERGNNRDYLAPDAFVAEGLVREPPPRVYRLWLLPRLLFAAEIGSISNTRELIEAKRERYAAFVRPRELLETDPVDEEVGEMLTLEHLHLYRLTEEGYAEVERQPNGRFWSATLELEIGVDETNNLRLYTAAGERVLTHEEEQEGRLAAVQQANVAGARAEEASRERVAAEQRAQEAQQRAADERAQRLALERELAALRARLADDQT
jgi:Putative restriction endonuclease